MGKKLITSRRQLLQGLGLAGTAWVAPAVLGYGVARASGGGSGGGSGGSGGSGGGGASGGGDGWQQSGPSRPQPARRAAAPRPEMVLLSAEATAAALRAAGYSVLQTARLPDGALFRLRLPAGRSLAAARRDLAQRYPAALLDGNTLYHTEDYICDETGCLAHAAISWPRALPGLRPRIGMIDTGINTAHEALAGQSLRVHQADLGGRAVAGRRHGTAVAALLVGRAESRTPGLLPDAELIAVEAFHRGGRREAADAFALAAALERLIAAKVSVINLSFAGEDNTVLRSVAARAAAAGIALVAAAGNGGPGAAPAYPAAWPGVIAVTAIDAGQNSWRQANRGSYIRFAAPGVNLWTAASISGGRLKSGTSYAAPFVTAALAARIAQNPGQPLAAHLADLERCTQDLGAPGRDAIFGTGLISMTYQCGS